MNATLAYGYDSIYGTYAIRYQLANHAFNSVTHTSYLFIYL